MAEEPDGGEITIFRGRRIHTMGNGPGEALATFGERIVAAGSARDLSDRFPAAEVVDFGEAVIVPGFNDSHIHLAMTTDDLLHIDLSASVVSSVSQIQDRIREEAKRTPAGRWIQGSSYDDSKLAGGSVLTRQALDAAAPDHPVLVMHVAGHWGVVNSRALALARIDDSTEPPPGGAYGRDATGSLNGILYEQALADTPAYRSTGRPLIPPHGLEERLPAMSKAVQMFHSAGLTSIGEAYAQIDDLALFREGIRRDLLTLRVNALVAHTDYDEVRKSGLGEVDSQRLRLDGVKAFVDGAIGGRTCLLSQPFEGTSDDYGIQTTSTPDLADIVRRVHQNGDRVGIHANGDRAISLLLDQLERAQDETPRPDLRHRIEHCTIVSEEILQRIKRVGAVPVPFGSYVHYYGEKLLDWYGPTRVARMFAHRSFLDMGIPVLGSSDYPCGPYQPLLAFQSCVTREGYDGAHVGANQQISPFEALSLYTVAPAASTGEGRIKGRLLPNYLADFAVLGADPLEVEAESLGSIPVLQTYVGGRRVWPT